MLVFIKVQVKLKIALIIRDMKSLFSFSSSTSVTGSHLIRGYMVTVVASEMWPSKRSPIHLPETACTFGSLAPEFRDIQILYFSAKPFLYLKFIATTTVVGLK